MQLNRQGLGDGVAELVVLICVHASFAADPAATVNDAEVPVLFAGAVTEVTVSVVDCASNSVIDGVALADELKLKLLFPAPHPPADG